MVEPQDNLPALPLATSEHMRAVLASVIFVLATLPTLVTVLPQLYFHVDPRGNPLAGESIEIGPMAYAWMHVLMAMMSCVAVALVKPMWVRMWLCVVMVLVLLDLASRLFSFPTESWHVAGWLAAITCFWASASIGKSRKIRRWMVALLIALCIPTTINAVKYVTVDHPQTVVFHQQYEEQWLESHGWERDSPAHQIFTRRALDPAFTGAVGLSNVQGTIATVLLLLSIAAMLALMQRRMEQDVRRAMIACGLACIGIALVLLWTYSRGAVLAAGIGLSIFIAGACLWHGPGLLRRVPRWLYASLALLLCFIPTMMVLVRGWLGRPESWEGERSLLFRAYYLDAGLRALISQSPMQWFTGLGVDGLAWKLPTYKSPYLPEDVSSLHHVFMDNWAMLGLAGVLLSLLMLLILWCGMNQLLQALMAKNSCHLKVDHDSSCMPITSWLLVVIGLFGTALIVQLPLLVGLIEARLIWVISLVGFIAIAAMVERGLVHCDLRWIHVGLLAAWVAAVVHGQLDMSFFHPQGAIFLAMIAGLSVSWWVNDEEKQTQPMKRQPAYGLVVILFVLAVIPLTIHASIVTHQQRTFGSAWRALTEKHSDVASSALEALLDTYPAYSPAIEWWLRLQMESVHIGNTGLDTAVIWEQLFSPRLDAAEEQGLSSVRIDRWRATILGALMQYSQDEKQYQKFFELRQAALERVVELRPNHYQDKLILADVLALNSPSHAAELYEQVLAISDRSYLDPAQQLQPKQYEEIEQKIKLLREMQMHRQ